LKKSNGVAVGGVLAAAAMVIMCLGGLVPIATYICPMLCALLLFAVFARCGERIAWAWYGAVALLALLMGPDKEASAVFLCLGYYPILKPNVDRMVFPWLWKLLLFNGAICLLYLILLRLLGIDAAAQELQAVGIIWLAVMLILGNVTFILLDRFLSIMGNKLWK
jgi:hypothetical protein